MWRRQRCWIMTSYCVFLPPGVLCMVVYCIVIVNLIHIIAHSHGAIKLTLLLFASQRPHILSFHQLPIYTYSKFPELDCYSHNRQIGEWEQSFTSCASRRLISIFWHLIWQRFAWSHQMLRLARASGRSAKWACLYMHSYRFSITSTATTNTCRSTLAAW
jgi:hypothetical protein